MKTIILTTLVASLLAAPAMAILVEVSSVNGPEDPLSVNGWVDEFGDTPFQFPVDFFDSDSWDYTTYTPCSETPDDPDIPNVWVGIRNYTGRDFPALYYVSDPETSLTNYDGWVNGQEAFRIDAVGINTPLVHEDILQDGIFQDGELWEFVIQDYTNSLGGLPNDITSVASVANSSAGNDGSTGSIITPEPATILLLALGSLTLRKREC